MTHNQAAEALGAIGSRDQSVMDVLREYAQSPIPEVRDTCLISLELLDWKEKNS